MSDTAIDGAPANPFSPRAVLALVLFGAAVFVALLWMIGAGMTGGSTNDGGGHAGGKGLNGYAALADLLERRAYAVSQVRSTGRLDDPGLLVLTPPAFGDADKIGEIIASRRRIGPTLLVLPKWQAAAVPPALQKGKAKKGWVTIGDAVSPRWGNEIAAIGPLDLRIDARNGATGRWQGLDREGMLAAPQSTQAMTSGAVVTLVQDGDGQALAAFLDDDGTYPGLDEAAGVNPGKSDDEELHPLVIVSEPDLLNNYGLADRQRAMLALALVDAAMEGEHGPVSFDLTLNGFGRSANLLTLAFTPPFLAATLCLLIAALAVGWRAFLRFGPPRRAVRAIAFGKQALVANAAGLIRRTRRLHLVTAPYADRARERIARALALPRLADAGATEAAIDRALAARTGMPAPFSTTAARLRAARRPHDILKAAQDLHALERTLKA